MYGLAPSFALYLDFEARFGDILSPEPPFPGGFRFFLTQFEFLKKIFFQNKKYKIYFIIIYLYL